MSHFHQIGQKNKRITRINQVKFCKGKAVYRWIEKKSDAGDKCKVIWAPKGDKIEEIFGISNTLGKTKCSGVQASRLNLQIKHKSSIKYLYSGPMSSCLNLKLALTLQKSYQFDFWATIKRKQTIISQ